jgi:branched-chain amino acid transport system substrate-binding protein
MLKLLLLSAAMAALTLPMTAKAAEPIKLGVLEDQSGDFALATIGKVHGIQLAADEINKAGGIAGRPLELVIYDTQSDNTRFQEFMRRVLQKDKADAVFAAFSSASREAYRPIVDQLNGFVFYNNQYEGGVCDAHMIVTGAVPDQQFSTLIPWMMEKFGTKVYTIAADNFGRSRPNGCATSSSRTAERWSARNSYPRRVAICLDHPEYPKSQARHSDHVAVGTAQSSYYEQAAAANLHIPMGSSVNVGQAYEHKRFKPPSLANMYVTTNWIEEVDDQKSKDFVAKWHKMFPNEPYINQEAENSYLAVYLYKEMVERAKGSTKRDDLRKIVDMGDVCFDAPEGKVCIDLKSQHMSHTIYLAKVK